MNVLMDQNMNVAVILDNSKDSFMNQKIVTSDYVGVGGDMGGDMYGEVSSPKDPLLSSWPFVIGISMVTLIVGIGLGIFLAKRRIKKGIDLYED